MACTFSSEDLESVIRFHGHSCPGLAIGVRVSELALDTLSRPEPSDLVAVCETDMCGVDAIQFFSGCTIGKGNLLLLDYGKMAFQFFDRKQKRGFRALFNDGSWGEQGKKFLALMGKVSAGKATAEEQTRLEQLRAERIEYLLGAELDELFRVEWLDALPPRPAKVLESLACEECGEKTMESRTRRFAGKTLCIPCFQKVEQKR